VADLGNWARLAEIERRGFAVNRAEAQFVERIYSPRDIQVRNAVFTMVAALGTRGRAGSGFASSRFIGGAGFPGSAASRSFGFASSTVIGGSGFYVSGSPTASGLGLNNQTVHGNSLLSTRTAYLYGLYRDDAMFLKWGTTQHLGRRYSKAFMRDKYFELVSSGRRADILKLERELAETKPGPWNREPWRGTRAGGQP
jgi:hypothetical protein